MPIAVEWRPIQGGSRRAQAAARAPALSDRPGRVRRLVAVRCPGILRRAGAAWEPGSRRWLVQRKRIAPVIRAFEAATNPLFRRAGVSLD
jgi:hypothetical protein